MIIYGFTGYKGTGKDTAAHILADILIETGQATSVRRVAFADNLKLIAGHAFGRSYSSSDKAVLDHMNAYKNGGTISGFDGSGERLFGTTYRSYLQDMGLAAREVIGIDVWLDAALPTAAADLEWRYPNTDALLVTDVRFPNECARLQALDGKLIEIVREGCRPDGHASENGVDKEYIAFTVPNNGTREELETKLREVVA